ncbi:MAG TPA: hypothetical protein PK020_22120 [Ilumatobacteraceae bacterium]|nr:hypothetical protein [Ilumatobacteraceae bacterium]
MFRSRLCVVVVLLLAACTDGSVRSTTASTGPGVDLPSSADIPEGQREALADGQVTVQEYRSAFDEWTQCAAKDGGVVAPYNEDPATGLILYSTGSPIGAPDQPDLSSPEGRCYAQTFSWIDLVFQSSPAVLEHIKQQNLEVYRSEQRPCLLKNDIDAPEDVEIGSAEYGQLLQTFVDLTKRGKC